jgi:hypothetical protein
MKETASNGDTRITDSRRVEERNAETLLEPTAKQRSGSKNVNPEPPIQTISERFPAEQNRKAVLTFFDPKAKTVCVAGTFNNWSPNATPLKNGGCGEWTVELLLRPGQYEYRFVVDGEWMDDPRIPERLPNSYGGFNSVLTLKMDDRTFFL